MNIKPNNKRAAIIVAIASLASLALFATASAGQTLTTVISLGLVLVFAVPVFAALLAFNWTADR